MRESGEQMEYVIEELREIKEELKSSRVDLKGLTDQVVANRVEIAKLQVRTGVVGGVSGGASGGLIGAITALLMKILGG